MILSEGPGVGSPGCDLGGFLEEDMGLCPLPLWGSREERRVSREGFSEPVQPLPAVSQAVAQSAQTGAQASADSGEREVIH